MSVIADTSNTGRQRARVGRRVRYYPTAAEATATGYSGPYPAIIEKGRVDRTFDVRVQQPAVAALFKTAVKANSQRGGISFLNA